MKKPALVLLIAGAVVGGLVAVGGGIDALIYFGGRGFGGRPPGRARQFGGERS